jgi:hypothetical protein
VNKEQIENILNQSTINEYNELLEAAREFIDNEYIPKYSGWKSGSVDEIELQSDGTIYAEASGTYCGCCYDDYDTYIIPISYLYDDSWTEIEDEKKEQARLERERRQEEERKAEEIRLKERRYAQYLRLKEEFENVE